VVRSVHGCALSPLADFPTPVAVHRCWSLVVPGGPWWFLLVPDENFHRGVSPFEFPGCQNLVASTAGFLALSFGVGLL
jgi:hypothetical protein